MDYTINKRKTGEEVTLAFKTVFKKGRSPKCYGLIKEKNFIIQI